MEKKSNLWEMTLSQLDEVAEEINLDENIHQILRHPKGALLFPSPYRWTVKK